MNLQAGQYAAGWQEGEQVKGHRQEDSTTHRTQPFAAIKFY
jgi:glucose-6-phosphate 1-dehydrogenase